VILLINEIMLPIRSYLQSNIAAVRQLAIAAELE
jgi:hypothetical protein